MSKTFKIINGDVIISNVTGRPVTITGLEKTSQDIHEFFEISIQPNGFGAGIDDLVGVLSYGGDSLIVGLLDRRIREGIAEFRTIQRSNIKIPRSADERIAGVSGIQASQDPQDPTKFYFRANVITDSGRVLPVSNTIGDK